MRVLIVYAHPNSASFNHAMLESTHQGLLAAGHEVRIKDLYAENFDPVLRASDLASLQTGIVPEKIAHEQEALLWAEGLVFIYPLWWRIAYRGAPCRLWCRSPKLCGLLMGKSMISPICNWMNTPKSG